MTLNQPIRGDELRWNVRRQKRRTIACNASNTRLVRWIWRADCFAVKYPYVASVLDGWLQRDSCMTDVSEGSPFAERV